MTAVYRIEGMHCNKCVEKVTAALRQVPGVRSVSVSLKDASATLDLDQPVSLEELNRAVSQAGDYRLTTAAPSTSTTSAPAAKPASLYLLFLIVGYILGSVLIIAQATGDWAVDPLMRHFMAGFFLVFSFFKLLDPPGFVSAYRGYDMLAKASPAWAWAYPFVELALGVAYLMNLHPVAVNSVTLVLMLIGSAGVLRAILDKRAIQCACLGTALNLPMTKVTLMEDLTMAAMAAAMLVMRIA